jgi:hypothetical protein
MASPGASSFAFVASDATGKPKSGERRKIRSHAMIGRNIRIGVRPVPDPPVDWSAADSCSETTGTPVSDDADDTYDDELPWSEARKLALGNFDGSPREWGPYYEPDPEPLKLYVTVPTLSLAGFATELDRRARAVFHECPFPPSWPLRISFRRLRPTLTT